VKKNTIQIQNKEHLQQHKIEMSKKDRYRGTSRKLTVGGTSATAASKNQMTPCSTEQHQRMEGMEMCHYLPASIESTPD
jgi:hypothetical protein